MKILSLNLHHHLEVDSFKKLETIASKIVELDVDVVMLQEMGQYALSDMKYDDIRYDNNVYYLQKILTEKHSSSYFFYPSIFKRAYDGMYEEGSAILSKQKIEVSNFPVSKSSSFDNWETRFVQGFSLNGISFYNVHFGWDTENEKFSDQVNTVLERNNGKKMLIGDFNQEITPEKMGFDYFDPFFEKYQNKVMTWNDKAVIDFCMMNFVCESKSEYLFVDDKVSDHIGLFVDIHIEE